MSKITKEELYNLKERYTTMQIFSLIRKNTDYEDFLVEYYKDISTELTEMVYLFYNNMDKPKCEICGTYVNWQGKDRYKPTCSIECGITLKKQKTAIRKTEKKMNKKVADPIHCKICNEPFNGILSPNHLQYNHDIDMREYKKLYGDNSNTTELYRQKMSGKYSGENNYNYGKKMPNETIEKIRATKKKKYASGEIVATWKGKTLPKETVEKIRATKKKKFASGETISWNKGGSVSQEVRDKISNSVKKYASENKEQLTENGKKSYQTRLERYGEEYVKNHQRKMMENVSEEGKKRQIEAVQNAAKRKREKSEKDMIEKLESNGYSNISFDKATITYTCPNNKLHVNHKQYFYDCRFEPECKMCLPKNRSKAEIEVYDYVCSLEGGQNVLNSDKIILWPKELDIVIPNKKIAIEYNGLYWHSIESGKDRMYHYDKYKDCKDRGFSLIQIFEDEWNNKPEIVKSILRNKLGYYNEKIFARKTIIKEISTKDAREFLDTYHVYGYNRCNTKLGLYYNDELVQVMTFSKSNKSRKHVGWEIDRLATKFDTIVVGGSSKLFKYFLNKENPENVISYADLRYGEGNVYSNLGFQLEKHTVASYFYFIPSVNSIRIHRYTLRKTPEENLTGKTEFELRSEQGFHRIYDCGHNKWLWKSS